MQPMHACSRCSPPCESIPHQDIHADHVGRFFILIGGRDYAIGSQASFAGGQATRSQVLAGLQERNGAVPRRRWCSWVLILWWPRSPYHRVPQEGISCRPNDGSHRAFGLHQRQRVLGRLLGLFLLPLDNLTCRQLAETSDVGSRADCRDAVSRIADHFRSI